MSNVSQIHLLNKALESLGRAVGDNRKKNKKYLPTIDCPVHCELTTSNQNTLFYTYHCAKA